MAPRFLEKPFLFFSDRTLWGSKQSVILRILLLTSLACFLVTQMENANKGGGHGAPITSDPSPRVREWDGHGRSLFTCQSSVASFVCRDALTYEIFIQLL
jgi:hypothetical protein